MGSALIDAGATIVAACIAALIVMHQLKVQAMQARQQAALSERLKLNLDIYREIVAIGLEFEDVQASMVGKLQVLRSSFIQPWMEPAKWGGYRPPPSTSGQELLALHGAAHTAAVKIITLIENWQVIDKRLDLYQVATVAALHDARTAWDEFFRLVASVTGFQPLAAGPAQWQPPANYDWESLEAACAIALDKWGMVECYIHDFRVEMQNLLTRGLFNDLAPTREPLDPRKFALSFDHYEAQKSYFDNDSDWAKYSAKVHADTLASLASRDAT